MPHRCAWADSSPQMQTYHDDEWGVPSHDSRHLWEMLILEGFQAGLSWSIILRKREGFRRAFLGFDPAIIAAFNDADVERLMLDEGIVRARSKIVATIGNARAYLAMQATGEDFAAFLWGFTAGKPLVNRGPVPAQTPLSVQISKALKARGFKFVGPVVVYAWMQAAGLVDDHSPTCFRAVPSQ